VTKPESRPPLITCRRLVVGYGGRGILPPFDFEIRTGEFWALLGNNGSGKTTLVRTLLGLLARVEGDVERAPETVVSYVPQRTELDPTIPSRVVDFVRAGRDRGWSFLDPLPRRDHEATRKALNDARCGDLAYEQLSHLSEGQKARAVLARALVSNPNVLVLDEPTSAVDAVTERAVFELLDALRRERDLALIVVSHRSEFFVGRATHAVYVDRAGGVATAGEFDTITRSAVFISRHGPIASPAYPPPVSPMH
jgi:ABC-type Mn2+/Zn2+ transport system ATPase subunit